VRRILVLAALLVVTIPLHARAQGGPPLLTDDPDTPGPGHWEINLSTIFEKSRHARILEVPRLDANYGVGQRIQLKFEVPWLRAHETGEEVRTGPGNSVIGVKYRFLGQEGTHVAWSVYPQLELNTSHASVDKRLVEDGAQFLFPTEITVEAFHVEVNFEVGRNFARHDQSGWVYGVSTEGHVTKRLELLAELHGNRRGDHLTDVIANVGARHKLTQQLKLMLAMGRAVHGDIDERPRLLAYVGIQFNLPGPYTFPKVPTRR
jgi:hypothetical protein